MGLLAESAAASVWLSVSAYDLYPKCSVQRHFAVPCWKFTMLCCSSMSFVGVGVMSFCQHLFVFGLIYIPTKHRVQAQTSFRKARAQTSTMSSLGILGVQQNSLKSPSACPNRGLADQSWNALWSDILMLCFFSLQEASSSVYHENRQHGSVPRSSLQNMAKVTKRGLSAL